MSVLTQQRNAGRSRELLAQVSGGDSQRSRGMFRSTWKTVKQSFQMEGENKTFSEKGSLSVSATVAIASKRANIFKVQLFCFLKGLDRR